MGGLCFYYGRCDMDYFEIVPNITDKIKREPNEFSHYNALYNVCKNIEDLSEKMKATAANEKASIKLHIL